MISVNPKTVTDLKCPLVKIVQYFPQLGVGVRSEVKEKITEDDFLGKHATVVRLNRFL